tara:strand:- start:50 stop:484 length:435 start_codon:yes stop_codon:yes gene_type:complete
MTKYVSQEAYEAALANPYSIENTVYQSNPTDQFNPFSGGQGIMGSESIRRYLTPILQQVRQAYDENKINPYVQEVQQLTNQTFPDLNLNGGGLRGGLGSIFDQLGGMNQLQGGLDPRSQNYVSNTMQSSPNQNPSPFGTASFFR